MAREDIKTDNSDNLYLVNKELSLLSLLSLKKRKPTSHDVRKYFHIIHDCL